MIPRARCGVVAASEVRAGLRTTRGSFAGRMVSCDLEPPYCPESLRFHYLD